MINSMFVQVNHEHRDFVNKDLDDWIGAWEKNMKSD
jgi:hypothetical protein